MTFDSYDPTSWRMILDAGSGDRSQRRRFAERYEALIRGCLHRRWRGSARLQWLDDACQEVFVECYRDGGVLARIRARRPPRFRAYLLGVIQNVARGIEQRSGRSAERHAGDEALVELAVADEADLLSWFEREWARTVLRDALHELARLDAASGSGRSAADLLELRFAKGLPIRDIASLWREEPARVHRDYAKARSAFQRCLHHTVRQHDALSAAEADEECRRLLALIA